MRLIYMLGALLESPYWTGPVSIASFGLRKRRLYGDIVNG
jgi:hypothetical protein